MRLDLAVDPVFTLLAVAALALLFGSAALAKLRDPARFAAVLEAYAVMPQGFAPFTRIIAFSLPFIELAVAVGLVLTITRPGAAWAAGSLLFIYGAGIALNLTRGRRAIDCGCEGFGQRRPIGGWMLVRNALLIALAIVAGAPQTGRAFEMMDALTVFGGLAAIVMTYFAADELLARRHLA